MEEKIDKIVLLCERLEGKVIILEDNQNKLQSYTNNLSHKVDHFTQQNSESSGIYSPSAVRETPGPSNAAPREQQSLDKDILQAKYRAVARKYQAVELHPDLTFKFQKSGVKKNLQQASNIINRAAEYTESILKIAVSCDTDEAALEDITNVGVALHHYLKAERTGLLVKSKYGDETGELFRQIQNNTTDFDEDCLDKLGKAATMMSHLNSIKASEQQHQTQRPFRGYGYRGRGVYNYNRDYYGSFVNRGIPPQPFQHYGRGRGTHRGGSSQHVALNSQTETPQN